jgi:hypothetical protein
MNSRSADHDFVGVSLQPIIWAGAYRRCPSSVAGIMQAIAANPALRRILQAESLGLVVIGESFGESAPSDHGA